MNKTLNKLSLVAVAVMCAMPTGYRRAGFSLTQGANSLDVNQAQFDALDTDKNLTVVLQDANSVDSTAESTKATDFPFDRRDLVSEENTLLRNEKTLLSKKVDELTDLCTKQQKDILELEEQLVTALGRINKGNFDNVRVVIESEEYELDVSSAPQELHHWIEAIDDLNEEAPLTKKPNCDLLTITVDDNSVTPTAAERDDAWAWYEANAVASTDATQAEAKA